MKPSIELHIEELVLTGVPAGDSFWVAQVMRARLVQLLREHGLPPALAGGADLRSLSAGEVGGRRRGGTAANAPGVAGVPGSQTLSRESLGRGVADAVFSGFKSAPK